MQFSSKSLTLKHLKFIKKHILDSKADQIRLLTVVTYFIIGF